MTITDTKPASPPLDIAEPEAHWETIDTERANELLEMNTDNRGMRDSVVVSYAREMTTAQWLVSGETVKVDYTGRLIDGQHRLAAIVMSGQPQKTLVVTGLDPAAQRVIDVNVRRSAGDILRQAGIVVHNINEVASAARIAVAFERGNLRRYGTIREYVSHQDIFEWVTAHEEINELAMEARRLFTRLVVPPSPLLFAHWRLSQINAGDALEFFTSTAHYATTGDGDPRAALLRVLNTPDSIMSRRPGTVIGVIFAAWNAWRDGQQIRSLPLVDTKGQPMLIETPM